MVPHECRTASGTVHQSGRASRTAGAKSRVMITSSPASAWAPRDSSGEGRTAHPHRKPLFSLQVFATCIENHRRSPTGEAPTARIRFGPRSTAGWASAITRRGGPRGGTLPVAPLSAGNGGRTRRVRCPVSDIPELPGPVVAASLLSDARATCPGIVDRTVIVARNRVEFTRQALTIHHLNGKAPRPSVAMLN